MTGEIYSLSDVRAGNRFEIRYPKGTDIDAVAKTRGGYLGSRRKHHTHLQGVPGVSRIAIGDADELAPLFNDIEVKRNPKFSELPDRLEFQQQTFVSERCKQVLQRIDPQEKHVFIRAHLSDSRKDYTFPAYYWLVCRRAYWSGNPSSDSKFIPISGAFLPYAHRHIFCCQERLDFFKQQPFWAGPGGQRLSYIGAQAYQQIQDEGLTGFELEHDPRIKRPRRKKSEPKPKFPGSVERITF